MSAFTTPAVRAIHRMSAHPSDTAVALVADLLTQESVLTAYEEARPNAFKGPSLSAGHFARLRARDDAMERLLEYVATLESNAGVTT